MRVWDIPYVPYLHLAVLNNIKPLYAGAELHEFKESGKTHVRLWQDPLKAEIRIEEVLEVVVKQTLHGVYYLKGWTLEEGEALAKFISPEVSRRTNGLFFETIAFKTDDGRIGIVGNE